MAARAVAGNRKCPKCGSPRIYPSRLRSIFERFRRALTEQEPHRCHACNYRAWEKILVPAIQAPGETADELPGKSRRVAPVTADDLDRLDSR